MSGSEVRVGGKHLRDALLRRHGGGKAARPRQRRRHSNAARLAAGWRRGRERLCVAGRQHPRGGVAARSAGGPGADRGRLRGGGGHETARAQSRQGRMARRETLQKVINCCSGAEAARLGNITRLACNKARAGFATTVRALSTQTVPNTTGGLHNDVSTDVDTPQTAGRKGFPP